MASNPTVAAHMIDALARAGVRHIYGMVGDSLNSLTEAVRSHSEMKWIGVRHEETAAFAAGAEAQLTGRLAVCAGSSGPGCIHLINGLYDAHRSMAPVLAIAAHIPSTEIGTSYFQEAHPERVFADCSHYCELVSNQRQMPRTLQIAMQHAISQRGVSVIVLPGDIAEQTMEDIHLAHPVADTCPSVRPCDSTLQNVAGMPDFGTDLINPNFADVAQAMGGTGTRVEDPSEVHPALEKALATDGPVLVDVRTNPSELSMPPKASLSQAKGYSLYLLKEILGGDADGVLETLGSNLR